MLGCLPRCVAQWAAVMGLMASFYEAGADAALLAHEFGHPSLSAHGGQFGSPFDGFPVDEVGGCGGELL